MEDDFFDIVNDLSQDIRHVKDRLSTCVNNISYEVEDGGNSIGIDASDCPNMKVIHAGNETVIVCDVCDSVFLCHIDDDNPETDVEEEETEALSPEDDFFSRVFDD